MLTGNLMTLAWFEDEEFMLTNDDCQNVDQEK